MEIIKTFTCPENIEYTLFIDNGKIKIKLKDLDCGEVVSLTLYPSMGMAEEAFDKYITTAA